MLKTKYICSIITVTLICLVPASNGYAKTEGGSEYRSPQHKVTAEEWKQIKENTQEIHMEAGVFRRVSSIPAVNPNDIVYTKDAVTKKTKVMVLDYGIFEKVGDLE
jgi:hypothetical protein